MNRLSSQKSPYLIQHKNNPVDWYPWGQEAFEAARNQNKPIFLSIGYSTCYWCHVMEKESFEDQEVASSLNKNFISIKLDREERPDIDQIYMDAVVGITGQGGWPMSVFLTPNLKPFFGGTYFPKLQFIPLLEKIGEVWRADPDSLHQSSIQLEGYLQQAKGKAATTEITVLELFRSAGDYLASSFDEEFGGFGGAPKFPQPSHIAFLFRLARRTANDKFLKMAASTLEAICRGGIYDQLGGGLHRYSVDRSWKVPHFEKMLYDNAQIVCVLVDAYQSTKQSWFLDVAKKTLDYALEILENKEGAFFAAEDAGAVGREGEYYVWKADELAALIPAEELESFKVAFEVASSGNFEHGTNILSYKDSFDELGKYSSSIKALLQSRNNRERPFKDTKIITSWNGLMISALCRVASVVGDGPYKSSARKSANFILSNLTSKNLLKRRYCDGEADFDGVLEDYSFFIQGLLDLQELTGDSSYFEKAESLQKIQDEKFWDDTCGGYFFSANSDVITRKKDYNDGATPSGNSVAALNLLRLYQLTGNETYRSLFGKLKSAMLPHAEKYPGAYTTFLSAMDYELEEEKFLVISGENALEIANQLANEFLPNTPICFASESGPEILRGKDSKDLRIYLCSNKGCSLPSNNISTIISQLKPTKMDI